MLLQYAAALADAKGKPLPEVGVEVETLGDGRYRVRVGEREHVVDARPVAGAGGAISWSLRLDSGRHEIFDVEGSLPDLKVTPRAGEPCTIKIEDARAVHGEAQGGAAGPAELRAPMPGKVVK